MSRAHTQTAVPIHRRTCYFTGRVQGVGFRYTVQNLALRYDVNGHVKNLADGRVEMVVEGPDAEMEQLVRDIQQRMNGFIRKLDVIEAPGTGEVHGFSIRH